mgnify:CR=1 FL=1
MLINNASMFYPTPLEQAQQLDWDELFNSNVRAAFFLCRSLSSELKSRSGCIINIVDAHADRGLRNHPIYNMAKSALKSMTKSLALDLGPSIRVNGVSPGAILWPPDLENDNTEDSKNKKEDLLKEIPLQRLGKPEDIANAAYFDAQLAGTSGIILPERRADIREVFHLYSFLCEERDHLQKFLLGNGIDAKIHTQIILRITEKIIVLTDNCPIINRWG